MKRIIKPQSVIISNIIFASFSIILFLFSIFILLKGLIDDSKFIETDAIVKTIISNEEERYIIVSYEENGSKHEVIYPYFDATLEVGDSVTIKYNPNNFDEIIARRRGYLFTSISFIFISIFTFLYNGLSLIHIKKEKDRIDNLLKNGKKYEALIIAVEEDSKNRLNGITPYVLYCKIEKDGKVYELNSLDIYINADISSYQGKSVTVYALDEEFINYFIDYTEVKNI